MKVGEIKGGGGGGLDISPSIKVFKPIQEKKQGVQGEEEVLINGFP